MRGFIGRMAGVDGLLKDAFTHAALVAALFLANAVYAINDDRLLRALLFIGLALLSMHHLWKVGERIDQELRRG